MGEGGEISVSRKRRARLAGSTIAGLVELFGFHPVDTIAKRLMAHEGRFVLSTDFSRVVLRSDAGGNVGIVAGMRSLFPGLGFAAGYKVLQRIYKFGGQPVVLDSVARMTHLPRDTPILHAVAGSMIGVGEVLLLPLDVLKIKSQNNPEALQGRGLVGILRTERLASLYRGAGWTAARNAPGSFALFGVTAFVKNKIFNLEDFRSASFGQTFVASVGGGVASITVASPLDVIKTRIQSRDFSSKETGLQILRQMLQKEGVSAFFKGLLPKILVVGPKLVFSFTIAQQLIARFERMQ